MSNLLVEFCCASLLWIFGMALMYSNFTLLQQQFFTLENLLTAELS